MNVTTLEEDKNADRELQERQALALALCDGIDTETLRAIGSGYLVKILPALRTAGGK